VSAITTHVLDTALGRPAAGVPVRLERLAGPEDPEGPGGAGGSSPTVVAEAATDDDGRARDLGPDAAETGTYRLVFDVSAYAEATGQDCFFPEVAVTFALTDTVAHHHVPLLLSPFAYSTYRGS
jgi:5-hydroxyisourate hydrolase